MEAPGATAPARLGALLDTELSYDATTSSRLSNHLPMALVALHRLGATDERLAAFAASYRSRLVALPAGEPIAGYDEWRAARGRHGTYGAHRAYFEACIGREGIDAAVRRHADALVDGLSGAAFHGIIRLAYALESRSDQRVAAGLAYLSEVHQPLGARGGAPPWTADPVAALRRLADVGALRRLAPSGNIGERMRQVAEHPSFSGVVDWLEVSERTPGLLTGAAVALYAVTDDFTALHAVTASHAVAVVAPLVEDRGALASWWFQGVAAAYVTIGAPRLTDAADPLSAWLAAPTPWDTIAATAIRSEDEHVIKLVYSARELHARWGEPLVQAAAARQAGIPSPGAGEG